MDTIIKPLFSSPATISINSPPRTTQPTAFNELVTRYMDEKMPQKVTDEVTSKGILVGEISQTSPTVSDLLMQHKELKASTWDIIDSAQNQNRDYTKIRPGTPVYYNSVDGALSWSKSTENQIRTERPLPQPPLHSPPAAQAVDSNIQGNPPATTVELGKISDTSPTVSHLLKNHPELRGETWNLLASEINRDKPFHTIPPGTKIYLHRDNMEISWGKDPRTTVVTNQPMVKDQEIATLRPGTNQKRTIPAANLSEAVQQYLGTSYDKINCYELIVKGLRKMDIPYGGKNGLYTKLTEMATEKGMASNAYLNGEGIVKAAGSTVLAKNYSGRGSWEDEATTLINEISPLLNNGQILSFSMEKRGHTGIVSQQDDQWTFINSGRLDNSVEVNSMNKGVGEEVLQDEIRNWFKLAHTKNETLSVTLGQLEQEKIRNTFNMPEISAQRG